jgi:hypothetical protein
MSGLRWAAVPVIAGALTGSVAVAAANEPPPAPTPTPTPTPTAPLTSSDPAAAPEPGESPTPEPEPTPDTGTVVYLTTVTTTTTTTNVNAPITVVAAPITTTLNSPSTPAARERFVMYLTGCGRSGHASPTRQDRVRYDRVRLRSNATLVVKVNGRQVAALQVPANARRGGQMLRLRLAPNGRLTIRRPSGRVLAVQGCTPA